MKLEIGARVTVDKKSYTVCQYVSRGASATVYRVAEERTGNEYALKVVWEPRKSVFAMYQMETERLQQLKETPNVIQLENFSVEAAKGVIYIVMELGMCDLDAFIQQRPEPQLHETMGLMRDMVRGILGCHDQGIVHFDLKPQNFLFVRKNKKSRDGLLSDDHEVCLKEKVKDVVANFRDYELKIADFGLSHQFETCQTHLTMNQKFGTLLYMAPEVIYEPGGASHLREQADIWSFGIILYNLVYGMTPHTLSIFLADEMKKKARGSISGKCSTASSSKGASDNTLSMLLSETDCLSYQFIRKIREALFSKKMVNPERFMISIVDRRTNVVYPCLCDRYPEAPYYGERLVALYHDDVARQTSGSLSCGGSSVSCGGISTRCPNLHKDCISVRNQLSNMEEAGTMDKDKYILMSDPLRFLYVIMQGCLSQDADKRWTSSDLRTLVAALDSYSPDVYTKPAELKEAEAELQEGGDITEMAAEFSSNTRKILEKRLDLETAPCLPPCLGDEDTDDMVNFYGSNVFNSSIGRGVKLPPVTEADEEDKCYSLGIPSKEQFMLTAEQLQSSLGRFTDHDYVNDPQVAVKELGTESYSVLPVDANALKRDAEIMAQEDDSPRSMSHETPETMMSRRASEANSDDSCLEFEKIYTININHKPRATTTNLGKPLALVAENMLRKVLGADLYPLTSSVNRFANVAELMGAGPIIQFGGKIGDRDPLNSTQTGTSYDDLNVLGDSEMSARLLEKQSELERELEEGRKERAKDQRILLTERQNAKARVVRIFATVFTVLLVLVAGYFWKRDDFNFYWEFAPDRFFEGMNPYETTLEWETSNFVKTQIQDSLSPKGIPFSGQAGTGEKKKFLGTRDPGAPEVRAIMRINNPSLEEYYAELAGYAENQHELTGDLKALSDYLPLTNLLNKNQSTVSPRKAPGEMVAFNIIDIMNERVSLLQGLPFAQSPAANFRWTFGKQYALRRHIPLTPSAEMALHQLKETRKTSVKVLLISRVLTGKDPLEVTVHQSGEKKGEATVGYSYNTTQGEHNEAVIAWRRRWAAKRQQSIAKQQAHGPGTRHWQPVGADAPGRYAGFIKPESFYPGKHQGQTWFERNHHAHPQCEQDWRLGIYHDRYRVLPMYLVFLK